MFLKQFAEFNSICIQCHDSPDADAMGAAFGLYAYFMSLGKKVKFDLCGGTSNYKAVAEIDGGAPWYSDSICE